ncbi:MAG: CPXCG motif-containing cysteine-rich protein [bacterium]|nr:CPXCG motif-containing cysteine-rich protein [bacterium]
MRELQSHWLSCPCCGEEIELLVDGSVQRQQYVEDCSVCCRPLIVSVTVADGEILHIDARREDE